MFLAAFLLLAPSAYADILMWSDADGVKHYTNSRKLVPADVNVSVVVEEVPHPAEAAAPEARAEEPPPPRQDQMVYDQSALTAAFAEGWQRGLQSVQETRASNPVTVQITGPLVAGGGSNGGYGGYGYGYGPGAWWANNYPALVTTGFDGGRSRHLTLRLLLQDQFAVDREGPYFVSRFPPQGLGPNLVTVLPRGLPMAVGPDEFFNRVITQ